MVKPQDAKDQLSWFQIEGIHGLPYVPWDEAEVPIYPGKGYCTHGSNLFPTWHRAYVALFEVRLVVRRLHPYLEVPPSLCAASLAIARGRHCYHVRGGPAWLVQGRAGPAVAVLGLGREHASSGRDHPSEDRCHLPSFGPDRGCEPPIRVQIQPDRRQLPASVQVRHDYSQEPEAGRTVSKEERPGSTSPVRCSLDAALSPSSLTVRI